MPRSENPLFDLPRPDSPTRPRISPRPTEKLTPSTARTMPSRVGKWVSRFSTCRVAMAVSVMLPIPGSAIQAGIEHVAQLVADQVARNNDDGQQHAGEDRNPAIGRAHG